MASRSTALVIVWLLVDYRLVKGFLFVCSRRRGFSVRAQLSGVHFAINIGIGYNFIHVSDPIPILKNKANITNNR